jgi:hypothetical protein
MAEQLRAVSGLCDGVRCDMAMLLLPDVIARTWGARALPSDRSAAVDAPFWPGAIAEVRAKRPKFLFMAEVYWDREWDLQRQGFDYTYDKRLYDRLCQREAEAVRTHLLADPEFQSKSVRFLENHDEPRARTTFPGEILQAAAVIANSVPGLRFFYEGELEGRRCHVPMHLGRRPDEPVDAEVQEFYARVLKALELPVLRTGRWRLLQSETAWIGNESSRNILGFSWELGDSRMLISVNYGPSQAQCYLKLPWRELTGSSFCLRDRLSDARYVRAGGDLEARGLYLDVPAWRAHMFDIEKQ